MKQTASPLALAICIGLCMTSSADTAQIDFETVPLGTVYGAPNDSPSDVVLSQDGIDMSVEQFRLGTFVGFFRAEIGGAYGVFFPTTPIGLNNISLQFDFADVGFDVNLVTVDYLEFGGMSNFSVNGLPPFELASLDDIPTNVGSGITASVAGNVITLSGDIDRFLVGGQEIALDNIIAIPEPTTLILMGYAGVVLLARRRRRAQRRIFL